MVMGLIQYLEKQCGDEDSYAVAIKNKVWPKVRKKLISKLEESREIAGVFVKGKYKGVDVSVFPNGRLIFKNVPDEDTLMSILTELLDASS